MRKIFSIIISLGLIFGVYYYFDDIINFSTKLFNSEKSVVIEEKNKYAKSTDYEYVQITNDFKPYSYQELINTFYTILDAGYNTFTFYCPSEYLDCISDVEKISSPEDKISLTTLGNYVSPFNNFKSINVVYDTSGEVTVNISHLYSTEEINKINSKIDELWNTLVKEDMKDEDIIYAFHDYIINKTKYDENYESGNSTYSSNKAIGPLFEGYAICSGYTDVMSLVLDRLNIKNYKVASQNHVWNALYINDAWKHIDLTWDDPVSKNRDTNNLLHKFYLINTKTLEDFKIDDHDFDKSIYIELK